MDRNRLRFWGISVTLAGGILMLGGFALTVVVHASGGPRRWVGNVSIVAYVGMAVLAVGAVLFTLFFRSSRCPMCNTWVHPWYYPTKDRHCPHCGKTLPEPPNE